MIERYRWKYPGDPVADVTIQTAAEFLAGESLPREMIITTATGEHRIDMGRDVLCDSCSQPLAPTDRTALTQRCLYCWSCYQEWIAPYLLK